MLLNGSAALAEVIEFPYSPPTAGRAELPMPATEDEIEELRGLLKWAKERHKAHDFRDRDMAYEALEAGLRKAIDLIGPPERRSGMALILLGAIYHSMRKMGDYWVTIDRATLNDALTMTEQLYQVRTKD